MSDKERQEVTSLVVETLLRFEEEKLKQERDKPWYKKPAGLIIIGVLTTVIATGIITFFASFQGSQKSLIKVQAEVKSNKGAIDRNNESIRKIDGKVEKLDDKINDTDKEWRDAVKEFYKDNPQYRNGKKTNS